MLLRGATVGGVCREEQEGCSKNQPPTSFVFGALGLFILINLGWAHGGELLDVARVWTRTAILSVMTVFVAMHHCVDFAVEAEYAATAESSATAHGTVLPPALRGVPGIREAADFFGSQHGQRAPAMGAYLVVIGYLVHLIADPTATDVKVEPPSSSPFLGDPGPRRSVTTERAQWHAVVPLVVAGSSNAAECPDCSGPSFLRVQTEQ
jgi:hypothetical protein